MAKKLDRLELLVERQEACATCVESNHGLPERKATHLVMEDVPWLLERLEKAKDGLKQIMYYNAVVYNGRSDEAGDMRRFAKRLLAELEAQ